MSRDDDDDRSPFAADRDDLVPDPRATSRPEWKIVIVDDEQEIHDITALALRGTSFGGRGISFLSAHSAAEAREALAENSDAALVLLDVVMETDDAGLQLVRHIRERLNNAQVRVVLRTGQPGQAPEATVIRDYDISDYRTKTEMTTTRLFTTVISALRTYEQLCEVEAQRAQLAALYQEQQQAYVEITRLKADLERERDYLRDEIKEARGEPVIGASRAFVGAMAKVDAVARSDASVLLLGESGVGKEVFARAIHERSPRAGRPLVKVNCASIPRELFESEFFGHVKGSFSGAHRDRVGRFQLADRGTLFLDEVGEIPLELQSKLLRALQEQEFERVGDATPQKVNVRIVAATNRDLRRAVEEGRFRADLYYRLSVFPIEIPPLRARPEDIVPLFEHVLARKCRDYRRPVPKVSREQARALAAYPWPGNVRELENVVERAVILSTDGALRLDGALPELSVEPPRPGPPPVYMGSYAPEPTPVPWGSATAPAPSWGSAPAPSWSSAPAPSWGSAPPPPAASPVPWGPPTPVPTPVPGYEGGAARKPASIDARELTAALERNGWKIDRTAAELGISRPSLYRLIDADPSLRKAKDLDRAELVRALEHWGGDLDRMSEALKVSKAGLRLRLKEEGLGAGKLR